MYDKQLAEIFKRHTGVDFENNEELWDIPFFGYKLNIPVREIALIILEISILVKKDKVHFALLNDKLYTYRQIKNLINNC